MKEEMKTELKADATTAAKKVIDEKSDKDSVNDDDDTKNCADSDETNSMTDDIDDDNTYEFEPPKTQWYGSEFIHWLVWEVIG
eukprot:CAMPEP_0170936994 /NCGR_PEP_ID=MMETSP0735-20130129/20206_1 /TAXON_ID=186038 /ORGANISM="Fragilariopsis kerguelensis, Strain L26-C5" /LENGTH=82 /DNA_ID=CAMNT_0011341363 /DNA_START=270 /DNA_END=518 /DNA_ORIENTATION=+